MSGVTGAGVVASIPLDVSFKIGPLFPPLSIEKFDNKINANNEIANVQVVLSKKLFVFCTPPKDCAPQPPNEEDNPPPFGFCTITIKIKITATNNMIPKNKL